MATFGSGGTHNYDPMAAADAAHQAHVGGPGPKRGTNPIDAYEAKKRAPKPPVRPGATETHGVLDADYYKPSEIAPPTTREEADAISARHAAADAQYNRSLDNQMESATGGRSFFGTTPTTEDAARVGQMAAANSPEALMSKNTPMAEIMRKNSQGANNMVPGQKTRPKQ